jgi:hypothetical protein
MQKEAVPANALPDLDALIAELDAGWDRLPAAALRQCQENAELVTPRLVATIEEVVRLGREGKVREGNAHFFAVFLLTEFTATEALPVILEAFSLPEEIVEETFGDIVPETLSRSLAVLGADHLDRIEAMIASPYLGNYVRWAAAEALLRMVVAGTLSRADALERLARQFRAAVAAGDEWAATIVASELSWLNPLEIQEEIHAAYQQGLIDESIIDWGDFEDHGLWPVRPGQCPALDGEQPPRVDDTVEELRDWNCFREQSQYDDEPPDEWLEDEDEEDDLDDLGYDIVGVEDDYADWHSPAFEEPASTIARPIRNETARVGRNDPCPCGSGKKYKKCCLKRGDIEA